jgi:hypothetical protein
MRFWDSSALVPLFVREDRSPILEALVADDPDMVVWWASPVECGSAVHRLRQRPPPPRGPSPPGRGRLPARGRPDVDPESHRRQRLRVP